MAAFQQCLTLSSVPALSVLRRLFVAVCLLALMPSSGQAKAVADCASGLAAPPGWTINPANYQFLMNMVIRVKYNNVPSNDPGNLVGVFVGPELRGFATPTNIGGQMYFFVTVYSNQYTGETLRFQAYYAPNDKVYSTVESVPFLYHHGTYGSIAQPFEINIDPNADFAPEILPIPADTTLVNIPFDPVNLADYLFSLDGDPVTWSAMAGPNLSATIINGILTVTPVVPGWTGTETIQIKATENTTNHYMAVRNAQFTILPDYGPPVFQPIPPQTIYPGGAFTPFDLDNYLSFSGPCRAFDFDVFPYQGSDPDPAWPLVAPGPQSMSVIARPLFADVLLAGPGAKLAAFVNNTLAGWAVPSGIAPNIYYALTLNNVGSGPITFRFYHAENQYLYDKTTALNFAAGGSVGSVAAPYEIQYSPLLPVLAADGAVQVNIVDPAWLGTYPVNFIVWDCNFPTQRRDTVQALFAVTEDKRPHFTTPPTANYKENACTELYDAGATDPNDSEGNGLTYSIAGGTDSGKFTIDPVSGKLSWFNFTPDYEMPGDANGDNKYEVTLRVTNTLLFTDDLALTVTVTDQAVEPFVPQVNGGVTAVCLVGSAVLQASGGGTYLWSTLATSSAITVTTTGTYTVTVTSDGGCTGSVTVLVSNKPTITAAGSNTPVCQFSPIQLTSTPSGGSGTYSSFSWAGPNSYSATVEDPAPFSATPAAAGTYTVTVTDNAGCSATATTTIAVSPNSAPIVTAGSNSPVCLGATIQLTATPWGGSGNYAQYKWAGPNNYVSNAHNPAGFAAVALSAGTYTVTLTDDAGCTATGTTSVQVKPLPTITATSNSPLCVGATVQLGSTASAGSGAGYTFVWAGPNSYASMQEDPAGFAAALSANGTYTVTVTDGAACTATASTTVSVTGLPTITAAILAPVCTGGNVLLGSTPAGGSGTYTQFKWAGPNGFTAMVEDPAAFPVAPAVAGTYTVTVTDQASCTGSATVSVTVNPVPAIAAMSSGSPCEGGSLTLSSTPSGGSTPYMLFKWGGPDNYVASIEDPAPFTTTLASSGVYTVTVTDNKGCTATGTTNVAVNGKPGVLATSNSPQCLNGNIDLLCTPSGGSGTYSAFSWAGPNGYSSTVEDPPGFGATLAYSGTYTVTVTDNKGCTATATTSVAVSTNPAPAITAMANTPVCAGTNLALTSSASGGSGTFTQYQWTGPDSYSAGVKNPAAFLASLAKAGTYTVTVTDNKGCRGTSSVTVVVDAPAVAPTANSPICINAPVQLMANPSGGTGVYTSFSWSGPNLYSANTENPANFLATASTFGTYTVTVTDNLNCTASGTVSVSQQDNDPPTITCPADQTLDAGSNCSATLGSWVGLATNVSDDCTASGNIIVSQMPVAGTVLSGHNDQETVTLTADDGTGNTTPCTFKVTLKDINAPTITCPSDQTVAADASCSGTLGNYVSQATNLTDNCTASGSIQVTQSPDSGTGLTGNGDNKTVTLTANDGNGNTTPCTFKVTLKDNTPPMISCPPDQTVAANGSCMGVVGDRTSLATASDNCGTVTVSQTPPANTTLTGHNDQKTVTLTATDGQNNMTPCSFKVTLKDVTPPSIICPGAVTVSCASNVPLPNTNLVTAVDNCSAVTKIHDSDSAPFDYTCVNRFKVTRVYRATDVVGNSATCSQVITVFDNTLPTFTFVPANVTVQCNVIPAVGTPTASDNCAGAVSIVYNGQTVSEQLCPDTYTLTRKWTATDACGNTRTATQRVRVVDVVSPTFVSVPFNVTVECNAVPGVGNPTATDNCDQSVTITYQGQTITPGTCTDNYIITRSWLAVDNCNNTRTATQRITVRDITKPVFTSVPGNVTIECSSPLPPATLPTATDNCDPTVTITAQTPYTTNATCTGNYQVVRVWQATDNCGNWATASQVITLIDTQKPAFTSVPANITIQCSDLFPVTPGPATASDNCNGNVQVMFTGQSSVPGNCPQSYVVTRVWLANDGCGNTVTATQTITVIDTQKPDFENAPANITISCTAPVPTVPVVTATDACDTNVPVVYIGEVNTGPGCPYTITRTWTVSDDCNNARTHTQVITVNNVGPAPVAPEEGANLLQGEDRQAPTPGAVLSGMQLAPNPALEEVWVSFEMDDRVPADAEATISLFDATGRLALRQSFGVHSGANRYRVDLSGLAGGRYAVQVKGDGWAEVLPLVVWRQ